MRKILLLLAIVLALPALGAQAAERWTPQRAHAWYAQQKWLVGTNYLPSTAINQLEMWQAEYREREVAIIKALAAAPRGQAPLP